MLNLTQIEEVFTEVNAFVKAALAGEAPADAIALAASIGSAIVAKGADPTADLAALKALNTFNADIIAAKKEAVANPAGVNP
jgi:hypothetical protein